jgi:hypothetical protein
LPAIKAPANTLLLLHLASAAISTLQEAFFVCACCFFATAAAHTLLRLLKSPGYSK